MKTNTALVAIFILLSLIFAASALAAPQIVHPRNGEGPVQVAERCGIDPKVFIELNRNRFINPKKISLIYTWQEFILPESNDVAKHVQAASVSHPVLQKVEQPKNELLSVPIVAINQVEKNPSVDATKKMKNFQPISKTKAVEYRKSLRGIVKTAIKVSIVIGFLYVLVMWIGIPYLEKRFPGIKLLIVFSNKPAKNFREYFQFLMGEKDSFSFICRCREDGVCTYVDWNENFFKFPDGIIPLAKFLAGRSEIRPVYVLPRHLMDRYVPLNKSEQRTLEKYKNDMIYST